MLSSKECAKLMAAGNSLLVFMASTEFKMLLKPSVTLLSYVKGQPIAESVKHTNKMASQRVLNALSYALQRSFT